MSAEGDAHSEMLELAVRLAEREGSGQSLSVAQRVISDIMWLGTQVSPNGFYGWLTHTSCARMRETREALAEVGCTEVAETVRSALALTGIDPGTMGDEERERCLNSLTEEDLRGLQAADWAFYDAYEKSMVLCRRYALEHGLI